MVFAKVRDKRTGLERMTTPKAYSIIPNRYELLGYVDEKGNAVSGPEAQTKTVSKTQKKSVEPAAKIEVRPVITQEERDIKMAELKAMNDAAIEKARQDLDENVEVKERKKPGPKPKQHA